MRALDVMSRELVTVSPAHSVWHATGIMLAADVSGLPVLDDDRRVVGIVTEGDLLHRCELQTCWPIHDRAASDGALMLEFVKRFGWSVSDVMTPEAISVSEDASLGEIAALMSAHRIKRVLVQRDGRLVGLVSRRDLMRTVAEHPPGETIAGDDRIRLSVLARLREVAWLLGEIPEVTVRNSVVTCTGRVSSRLARDVVRVIVDGVSGAAGLDDRLFMSDDSNTGSDLAS